MDFENAFAYLWYGVYNWVGVNTRNSQTRFREMLLDVLVYPCVTHDKKIVSVKSTEK